MQKVQVIDITKSYLPGDPNSYPENLISTDREDGEEKTIPVLPFEAYNVLPTAYGYRSYFGATSQLTGDAAPANCDQIILFQKNDYSNMMIAFTAAGVYTRAGAATAWTPTFALTDTWTASAIYKEYTWIVLDNDLYIYRQGHTHVLKIAYDGTATTFVPTFLNMAGQMGIFKAHGRLGFWDSLNSVSWSSALDYTNLTPDLETLAGNCTFLEVQGRIVTIKDHGEGFVIYATKSIVGIGYNTQGTQLWDAMTLTQAGGIGFTRAVVMGENNKQHFAYTSIGIFMIGHFNALSRQYDMQQIAPELFDFLKESRDPVYLDCFAGRYLHFGMLDARYINGITSFVDPNAVNTSYVTEQRSLQNFDSDFDFSGTPFLLALESQDYGGDNPLAAVISSGSLLVKHPGMLVEVDDGSFLNFFLQNDFEFEISYTLNSTGMIAGDTNFYEPIFISGASEGMDFYVDARWDGTAWRIDEIYAAIMRAGTWIEMSTVLYDAYTGTFNLKLSRRGPRLEVYLNDELAVYRMLDEDYAAAPVGSYTNTLHFSDSVAAAFIVTTTTATIDYAALKKVLTYPENKIPLENFSLTSATDFKTTGGGVTSYRSERGGIWENSIAIVDSGIDTDYDTGGAFQLGEHSLLRNYNAASFLNDAFWSAPIATVTFDFFISEHDSIAVTEAADALSEFRLLRAVNGYTYWMGLRRHKTTNTFELAFDITANLDISPVYITLLSNLPLDQWDTITLVKNGTTLTAYSGASNQSSTMATGLPSDLYIAGVTQTTLFEGYDVNLTQFPSFAGATDYPYFAFKNLKIYNEEAVPPNFYYSYPTPSFKLQSGSISPAYPEILGSVVFDLQLKKWGKNLNSYRCLIALSPLNETQNQTISFTNFGVDLGMLKYDDRTIRLFSPKVSESSLKYGKIGFYRFGFTTAQEVVLHFRVPSTGSVTIEGSINGKEIDSRLETTTTFTEAVEVTAYIDKSARWFNIAISGQFDLTYLEFRGTIAGRR